LATGILNVTKEDCLEIISKFEPSEVVRSIPALGIDGFTKYLVSERCNLFDPKHLEVRDTVANHNVVLNQPF